MWCLAQISQLSAALVRKCKKNKTKPCIRQTLPLTVKLPGIAAAVFRFHIQHFSVFLPTLTLADIMNLWSRLCGWAKEETGRGKQVVVFAA